MRIVPTDRTYFVVALARRAADATRDVSLTSEHMLYGLVMEGTGIAANVLHNHGISFSLSRGTVPRGDDFDLLLNEGRDGFNNLSGEAKELMDRAVAEGYRCRELWPNPEPKDAWIGTEHVLMAITKDRSSAGGKLLESELARVGMTLDDLHREMMELIFG